MSTALIQQLFESRLKTWADARAPALQVAFENVTFVPPAAAHLRAYTLTADTDALFLEGTHRVYSGIFQITIVCPVGNGAGAARAIASELASLFSLNLKMTSGAFSVFVRSPMRENTPNQEPNSFELPIDFEYRADTTPA